MQQKILWAEVQKETGKWKSRWKIRDLLADGRCGQAVLDFLSSTDVGRLVPPLEKSDTGSQVSEWELRDRREREEEREAEGGIGCRGGTAAVPTHAPPHGIGRGGVGDGSRSPFILSFVLSLIYSLLGQAWAEGKRGACNVPPPRGLRTGKPGKMYAAMIYIGRMRV